MSVKVFPPSVLTSHCTVSVPLGLRLAAVKVTVWPVTTIWSCGCVVTKSTVNVAAVRGKRAGGVGEDGPVFVAVFEYRSPVKL